jgi:hypothetical protein
MLTFMTTYKEISLMPSDLREFFGPYGPQLFDSYCGEPVAWGHAVRARMGEERWIQASEFGQLECDHASGSWFLITKWLTLDEALRQYGEVTAIETGPRGGFRSVTYGSWPFQNVYWRRSGLGAVAMGGVSRLGYAVIAAIIG